MKSNVLVKSLDARDPFGDNLTANLHSGADWT